MAKKEKKGCSTNSFEGEIMLINLKSCRNRKYTVSRMFIKLALKVTKTEKKLRWQSLLLVIV